VSAEEAQTSAAEPTLARAVRVARRIAKTSAITGLALFAVYVRVIVGGEREIAASTASLRAGDPHEAALHARRAAGWYAPGAPHVRVAYQRLIALATKAEGLGDRDTALFAWRAVRTASIETRWILTPHEEDRERADREIARLEASAPRPPGTRTEPNATIERQELATLERDEAPSVPWIIALVAAFAMWSGGSALAVRRGLGATGRWDLRRAGAGLTLTGIGILVWVVAMWRA
jgi:hypothetical protein